MESGDLSVKLSNFVGVVDGGLIKFHLQTGGFALTFLNFLLQSGIVAGQTCIFGLFSTLVFFQAFDLLSGSIELCLCCGQLALQASDGSILGTKFLIPSLDLLRTLFGLCSKRILGSFLARFQLKHSVMFVPGLVSHVLQLLLERMVVSSLDVSLGNNISRHLVVVVDDNTRVVSTRTEPKSENVPEATTIAALARQIAARIRHGGHTAIFALTACLS